ncbi:MAG: right-handed parallel beta-helix repeat-containing protein, partial [Pseudomonadota bacterium]
MRNITPRTPVALLLLALMIWSPITAQAALIQVNMTTDAVDVDPQDGACDSDPMMAGLQCTLRAAIMTAEANDEADRVVIPQGFIISLNLAGDGDASIGDLDITTEIEVAGFDINPPADPGDLPLINAFGMNDRIFDVFNGQLTVRGLRFQGGNPEFRGGAINVSGNSSGQLEVHFSDFQLNQASRGGAIALSGFTNLLVEDSNFLRNDSLIAEGAAIFLQSQSTATIRRSSFVDNRGAGGNFASTIGIFSSGAIRIENSTLDGAEQVPPTPGRSSGNGISTDESALDLEIVNSTVTRFSNYALRLDSIDSSSRFRVSHSILSGDDDGCLTDGPDQFAADGLIEYTLLNSETDCGTYLSAGGSLGVMPDLGNLTQDAAPRLTFARPPSGLDSNVVERGFLPGNPLLAPPDIDCLNEDQRGNPRPQDANADGDARCDLGAVEEGPPQAFVVDYFELDLLDSNPGDGQCTTLIVPGVGSVCTLRAAVMETNALPGLQRILFEPSDIPAVLTQPAGAGASGGDLNITDALAIEGRLDNGRPVTVIENQVTGQRLFTLEAGAEDVFLRNMDMFGGQLGTGAGGAIALVSGEATLRRLSLRNHFGGAGGGAVAVFGGRLEIEDSDLFNNNTLGSGAAVVINAGELSITNTSIRGHLGLLADGNPATSVVALQDTELALIN